jgi:hypothetical protein
MYSLNLNEGSILQLIKLVYTSSITRYTISPRCSVHKLTAVSYINSHGRTFVKKQGSNYGFAL